jgi:hypothetical protein
MGLRIHSRNLVPANHAFTEVLDTMLLLGAAIACFGIVTMNLLPPLIPSTPPNVKLSAYIRGDYLFIEHREGEPLQFENVSISVYIGNTSQPKPSLQEINPDGLWECGEYVCYFYNTTEIVSVLVIDTVSNTILLDGNLRRGEIPWIGSPPPLLISSLRTNTVDEDLICYAPSVSADTFVYNWKRGGSPIARIIFPFDVSARDYSENGYDGTVNGATLVSGKVGKAYSFDGIDDSIVTSLPISNWDDDFTLSFWMYSVDINTYGRVRCIIEIYIDEDNSLRIFQYNSTVQFDLKKDGALVESIRTSNLSNNTWYHIALVWSSSDLIAYVNGSASPDLTGMLRDYGVGDTVSLTIGQRSDGNDSFNGTIDEFFFYTSALSPEQIYQNYLDTREGSSEHRTIVSEETNLGESWSCTITPIDNEDKDPVDSETLIIVSYPGGG